MQPPRLRVRSLVIATLAVVGFAHVALAQDSVVLVSDDRGGYDAGQPCWEDFETGEYTCGASYSNSYSPPVDFGDWNGGGQNTQVEPLEMSGTGWGSAFSDYGWDESNTSFDITFDVLTPVEIELTGSIWAGGYWGGGETRAELLMDGVPIYEQSAYDSVEALLLDEILLPGRYRIHIWTMAYPISDSSFDFDLTMTPTPVPEPGTAALVGLGLLLVARASKR